jgi:hypothetical protein
MTLRSTTKRIALLTLIAAVFATSIAKSEIAPESSARRGHFAYVNYLSALADFDGDRRIDHAELHLAGTHHCIRVRFGNSRETHLDFGTRAHAGGVLLVWDANRDNKPDLIWVYRSRSQPAVIWLNDGAGHFAKADEGKSGGDALLADTGYESASGFENDQVWLAPARPPSEVARGANIEREFQTAVLIAIGDFCRDLGLYLSYLRERGPPPPA